MKIKKQDLRSLVLKLLKEQDAKTGDSESILRKAADTAGYGTEYDLATGAAKNAAAAGVSVVKDESPATALANFADQEEEAIRELSPEQQAAVAGTAGKAGRTAASWVLSSDAAAAAGAAGATESVGFLGLLAAGEAGAALLVAASALASSALVGTSVATAVAAAQALQQESKAAGRRSKYNKRAILTKVFTVSMKRARASMRLSDSFKKKALDELNALIKGKANMNTSGSKTLDNAGMPMHLAIVLSFATQKDVQDIANQEWEKWLNTPAEVGITAVLLLDPLMEFMDFFDPHTGLLKVTTNLVNACKEVTENVTGEAIKETEKLLAQN